jgi:site-specific recombinase XerD
MDLNESLKNENTLDTLLGILPDFCRDFFIGTATINTQRTQIRYAYNLKLFFDYVKNELEVSDITLEYMNSLTPKDIEEYIFYTSAYVDHEGNVRNNQPTTKSNKLSALRSLYKYLYTHGLVQNNPALLVNTPKIRKKEITTLSPDEIVKIMDKIKSGNGLNKKQLKFADKTRYRDLAIFTLLLTTGMRVSELVGINMTDVNFDACEIRIIRKGLKEQVIYISDEAEKALKDYIEFERNILTSGRKDLNALFISLKHQRISVRAVENMVKKFTSSDVTVKNITPHKLRSTFGTTLYNETGDIYLTATALGHESVNTTAKYYSKVDQERVRLARNIVKINED